MTVALVALVALVVGYAGGWLRAKVGPPAPPNRSALAAHVETLREIVVATDGQVSLELETAMDRLLETEVPDTWEVFWADMSKETDWTNAFDLLEFWAVKVRWDAKRRAEVVHKFAHPSGRARARRVVDDAWRKTSRGV